MSSDKGISPRDPAKGSGSRAAVGWGLARVRQEAVVAGVCAGLGRATGILPFFWRLLFAVTSLLGGVGAVVYGVFWLVMRRDPTPAPVIPPLFRRIDWWTALVTTLVVLGGYLYTLAPDLGLEDSGELAVGSYYLGVPHPPGYPLWTIYTWLFTVLLPFSNIAWRVAVSSAVAGAFSCGLVALIASRGCSMILESIDELKNIERRWESALCMAGGYVAGMLIGFNGFMWSQAVIVEVYPFSLLSFMGVLAMLLRWIHAPSQRHYLYWALFLFGVCFTNHQTLIVAAMGIEIAIAAAHPKQGRDLFLWNSIFFIVGLVLRANGQLTAFDQNLPLFRIFLVIGVLSIGAYLWLAFQTSQVVGNEAWVGWCMGLSWVVGAGFYFFMPLASSANPPMNWGYARTYEGFLHALTRGQYEKTNPTGDLERFFSQMGMLFEGAVDEFNLVYLAIAVIPFLFFLRLKQRERAWLLGLVSMYLFLAVLLIMLLNVSTDRQSRDLNRVFFTASHVMIALCVAYGMAVLGGLLATQYHRFRPFVLYGIAVAAALAFYALMVTFQSVANNQESFLAGRGFLGLEPKADPWVRGTAVFSFGLALLAIALFALARTRAPLVGLIGLYVLMPIESVLSHWSDNEQRGHLFGYWFGHDMFTPPYDIYPEMARDAVLFGGTDPGRFCPTYMIFCESFIPPECRRDPKFDRRDVYIITQNALADQTYLNYIRAHYHRSAQKDPPFFQTMLSTPRQRLRGEVGPLGRLMAPVDRWMQDFGARVEDRRRREGVYPPQEIYMPSEEDHAVCMTDYFNDANRRLQLGQLKPGEDVRLGQDGKLQVSGQIAVMAINGLLTKVIFDRNPTNEFYVEESFPLDWMFPHLEPFGIIMKINRRPLATLSEEILQKDHAFWSRYSERLVGNWITYDTTVDEICDFARRVHERRDYRGFTGDRKFIRDDQGQKAFSKLRSSIGGLYSWRISNSRDPVEQTRLLKEADFAYKQAFAFCPHSPEAVYRYTTLLVSTGRYAEAERVTETCLVFDRENPNILSWYNQIRAMRAGGVPAAGVAAMHPTASASNPMSQQALDRLTRLEAQVGTNPADGTAVFELASMYLAMTRTNAALDLFDRLLEQPDNHLSTVLSVANAFAQLQQGGRLERALLKLVQMSPESPEGWYDLATTQTILGKNSEAVKHLAKAVELSDARHAKDPKARDLRQDASNNPTFSSLRDLPAYRQMLGGR